MNTTPDKKLTPMGELIDRIKPLIGKYGIEADAMITTAIAEARSLLEAEREYASQQAPEELYTREQMEKAIEFGFNQCANNGCITTYEQKQFIQSINKK